MRSDVILIGEVLDVTIEENTYVRIRIIEYLKNKHKDERSEIVIRTTLYGKETDGRIRIEEDEPEFETGEQVLLFLEKDDGKSFFGQYVPKDYKVFGNYQGKYKVKDNIIEYRDSVVKKSGSIPLERFIPELKRVIEDPFGYLPDFFGEEKGGKDNE